MHSKRVQQWCDTALSNERHYDVDAIRRVHFGKHLAPNSRLAGGVRQESGIKQWNEWLRDRFSSAIRKFGGDGT